MAYSYITDKGIPPMAAPDALNSFLSKTTDSGEKILLFDDEISSGLSCSICTTAGCTCSKVVDLQKGKIKIDGKEPVYSFTCKCANVPANVSHSCAFAGNSKIEETEAASKPEKKDDDIFYITLKRKGYPKDENGDVLDEYITTGEIQLDGKTIYTLEPQPRTLIDVTYKTIPFENRQLTVKLNDRGCLPTGEYFLKYGTYYSEALGYNHFLISDKDFDIAKSFISGTVRRRLKILIHVGNARTQTEGCILVGLSKDIKKVFSLKRHNYIDYKFSYGVSDRKNALNYLYEHIPKDKKVKLKIE
jgi:hypothetical protein